MHGISQEGLQRASLAGGLALEPRQQLGEGLALLALRQHLQRVVVVADVLLVDGEHRQQHVEQVSCEEDILEIKYQ